MSILDGADAIAQATARPNRTPAARWRWATVTANNGDGTLDVEIDGGTLAGVTASAECRTASAGDRVRVTYLATDAVADVFLGDLPGGGGGNYAGSPTNGGNANATNGLLFGRVDATSTATAFTATVDGLESLYDGAAVMLENGVITSASGFTIDVNGLGAKPVYSNMAAATRDTTIFNVAYTMLFVYDEQRVDGGCWICYRGYDSNTNTIGYQLRTNSGTLPAAERGYRYRIWLTSADGSEWVPINTSTATNATTARALNSTPIDPFGPIVYNSTNGTVQAGARPAVATLWQQYALNIGYSFMSSGFALDDWAPVYLQCTPQADGSVVMADVVQSLPTSKDGYVYVYLGIAYSATNMELRAEHPVYWHDGTAIRRWTGPVDEYPLATLGGTGTNQFYAHDKTATLVSAGTTPSAQWGSIAVCTIPSGYRPKMALYFPVAENGAPQSATYLIVNTDGTVTLQNAGGTQSAVDYFATATWAY